MISQSLFNLSIGGVVARSQIVLRRNDACTGAIPALGLFVALTLVLTLLIPRTARAQSDDVKKQAQTLQVEGVRLLQKGDNRGALAKFNEAFTLVQSPKIMFNMGKAYRGLGNDVEALRAFDTFLDEAPFAPKASRSDAEREVQALRLKLSYVEVVTDDTDSTVRIDGREVGKAPLARPVVVLPGSHEVKVEKTGMVTDTRSIAPIAGQKIRVVARLTPVVARTSPSKPPRRTVAIALDPEDARLPPVLSHPPKPIDSPPVEVTPGHHPWQLTAAIITGGVGVLALGVGITGQILWSQKNTQFNEVVDTSGQIQCTKKLPDDGGGPCPGLAHAADQRLSLAIAGYAVAGAALTTALIFYAIAPGTSDAHVGPGRAVSMACLPTASAGLSSPGISCALASRF